MNKHVTCGGDTSCFLFISWETYQVVGRSLHQVVPRTYFRHHFNGCPKYAPVDAVGLSLGAISHAQLCGDFNNGFDM